MTEQDYLETRVSTQQEYFSERASSNKKHYYVTSILKLVISLTITVLSSVMFDTSPVSIIVAVLSAIMALIEGILLLCKYNENWIMYRMTSENLKKEEYLFKTRTGEYYMLDDSQAFNIFVRNIEEVIQNSNKHWEGIYNNKKGDN
ncbi:MAG: DUF4231 domain-containing protein [Bacteroides fragilis]|nr:DUF4231 domain-containing protein [Bacteroides fragilis]